MDRTTHIRVTPETRDLLKKLPGQTYDEVIRGLLQRPAVVQKKKRWPWQKNK